MRKMYKAVIENEKVKIYGLLVKESKTRYTRVTKNIAIERIFDYKTHFPKDNWRGKIKYCWTEVQAIEFLKEVIEEKINDLRSKLSDILIERDILNNYIWEETDIT